jgi:hypothetical protein
LCPNYYFLNKPNECITNKFSTRYNLCTNYCFWCLTLACFREVVLNHRWCYSSRVVEWSGLGQPNNCYSGMTKANCKILIKCIIIHILFADSRKKCNWKIRWGGGIKVQDFFFSIKVSCWIFSRVFVVEAERLSCQVAVFCECQSQRAFGCTGARAHSNLTTLLIFIDVVSAKCRLCLTSYLWM